MSNNELYYDEHIKSYRRHILLSWFDGKKGEGIRKLKEEKIQLPKERVFIPDANGNVLRYQNPDFSSYTTFREEIPTVPQYSFDNSNLSYPEFDDSVHIPDFDESAPDLSAATVNIDHELFKGFGSVNYNIQNTNLNMSFLSVGTEQVKQSIRDIPEIKSSDWSDIPKFSTDVKKVHPLENIKLPENISLKNNIVPLKNFYAYEKNQISPPSDTENLNHALENMNLAKVTVPVFEENIVSLKTDIKFMPLRENMIPVPNIPKEFSYENDMLAFYNTPKIDIPELPQKNISLDKTETEAVSYKNFVADMPNITAPAYTKLDAPELHSSENIEIPDVVVDKFEYVAKTEPLEDTYIPRIDEQYSSDIPKLSGISEKTKENIFQLLVSVKNIPDFPDSVFKEIKKTISVDQHDYECFRYDRYSNIPETQLDTKKYISSLPGFTGTIPSVPTGTVANISQQPEFSVSGNDDLFLYEKQIVLPKIQLDNDQYKTQMPEISVVQNIPIPDHSDIIRMAMAERKRPVG